MENYDGKIKYNNTNQGDEMMKAKSINIQIVKNLGNYETIRVGGEWELNGENLQDAIRLAVEELENAWRKPAKPDTSQLVTAAQDTQKRATTIETPQSVETTTKEEKTPQNENSGENSRELCRFKEESDLLQKIIKRVRKVKTLTIEDVDKYYELDEDARKVIEAAIKLRGK